MKALPESEHKRLRRLVNRGLTDEQMGVILGISARGVRARRRRWGISRFDGNRVLIVEIAAEFGLDHREVWRQARRSGVEMQPILNSMTVSQEDAQTLRDHYSAACGPEDAPGFLPVAEAARLLGMETKALQRAIIRRSPSIHGLVVRKVRDGRRWEHRVCPRSVDVVFRQRNGGRA